MKLLSLVAAALLVAGPTFAQTATNNAATNSASNASANSGSVSGSASISDQRQSLQASQGQANGQSITFNTPAPLTKTTNEIMSNQNVPLAASVSFSSDYCGGTASAGVSTSLGFSVGGSKPIMDGNCQSLRRAEKFSIIAATAHNLGQPVWAAKLLSMSIWEMCMSEENSSRRQGAAVPSTRDACAKLGLYGDQPFPAASPASMPGTPDDKIAASTIARGQRDEQAKLASAR